MNHNITGRIITVEILKEIKKKNHGVILPRVNGNIVIFLKFLPKNVSLYAYFPLNGKSLGTCLILFTDF